MTRVLGLTGRRGWRAGIPLRVSAGLSPVFPRYLAYSVATDDCNQAPAPMPAVDRYDRPVAR
jgi:hypothetical protein